MMSIIYNGEIYNFKKIRKTLEGYGHKFKSNTDTEVVLKSYLPDAMLTKVDRASMAASLEVRVPLLDHRVMEYTASLPENLKYRNGTGKYILKKLLAKYVPGELFERPNPSFRIKKTNPLITAC